MFLFYDVFINHFPKIHRSVLRKVTIDLLYIFEMFLMSIYGKKLLTQLVNQTYILEILLACRHLWLPKTARRVLGLVIILEEKYCFKGG